MVWSPVTKVRIALGIEYCGSNFQGWQTQPHRCTVQDKLQDAIAAIASEQVELVCAGRTDAGVHAAVQVAHFDSCAQRPLTAWVRGVNSHLPDGVCVTWAAQVGDDFHARFSARSRRYRYLLINRPRAPVHSRWPRWMVSHTSGYLGHAGRRCISPGSA